MPALVVVGRRRACGHARPIGLSGGAEAARAAHSRAAHGDRPRPGPVIVSACGPVREGRGRRDCQRPWLCAADATGAPEPCARERFAVESNARTAPNAGHWAVAPATSGARRADWVPRNVASTNR